MPKCFDIGAIAPAARLPAVSFLLEWFWHRYVRRAHRAVHDCMSLALLGTCIGYVPLMIATNSAYNFFHCVRCQSRAVTNQGIFYTLPQLFGFSGSPSSNLRVLLLGCSEQQLSSAASEHDSGVALSFSSSPFSASEASSMSRS
jgi:hypothetical protein